MKFLKERLPVDTIKSLDYLIHLLCRKTRELVCMKCLESCLNTNDFPRQYYEQLCKQKLPPTYRNLRRLTKSYNENINETHEKLQSSITGLIPIRDNFLSNQVLQFRSHSTRTYADPN